MDQVLHTAQGFRLRRSHASLKQDCDGRSRCNHVSSLTGIICCISSIGSVRCLFQPRPPQNHSASRGVEQQSRNLRNAILEHGQRKVIKGAPKQLKLSSKACVCKIFGTHGKTASRFWEGHITWSRRMNRKNSTMAQKSLRLPARRAFRALTGGLPLENVKEGNRLESVAFEDPTQSSEKKYLLKLCLFADRCQTFFERAI